MPLTGALRMPAIGHRDVRNRGSTRLAARCARGRQPHAARGQHVGTIAHRHLDIDKPPNSIGAARWAYRASPRLGSLDRVVPTTASHGTGPSTSSKGGWPRAVEAAARACDGRGRVHRRAFSAARSAPRGQVPMFGRRPVHLPRADFGACFHVPKPGRSPRPIHVPIAANVLVSGLFGVGTWIGTWVVTCTRRDRRHVTHLSPCHRRARGRMADHRPLSRYQTAVVNVGRRRAGSRRLHVARRRCLGGAPR